MIPYFQFTTYHLGPIPIQVWGTFVALGVLAGTALAAWFAKKRGQNPTVIWDMAFWVIVGAFFSARIFHVLFYRLEYFLEHPAKIIAIWEGGESVIGGLIGAAIVGIWYLHKKKLDVWAYADTTIFSLPLGYGIGRIGCFLIHDHPGTLTDFVLGIRYPDGLVRHDLGLYASINGFILAIIFWILYRRKAPVGAYTITFLLWYGITRFFLDFLRATDGPIVDARYFGLTPAQYGAIIMVGFGAYLSLRGRFRLSS
jgi:phosphatidylglycerol:prolipoprotein diacylglycerol transferase